MPNFKKIERGQRHALFGEVVATYGDPAIIGPALERGRPPILAIMDAYIADVAARYPGNAEVAAEVKAMRQTWAGEAAFSMAHTLQQIENETRQVAVWNRRTLRSKNQHKDDNKRDRGTGWYYDDVTETHPDDGSIFPRGPFPTSKAARERALEEFGGKDAVEFVTGEPRLYKTALDYVADYDPYLVMRAENSRAFVVRGQFGTAWTRQSKAAQQSFMVSFELLRIGTYSSPDLFVWIAGTTFEEIARSASG